MVEWGQEKYTIFLSERRFCKKNKTNKLNIDVKQPAIVRWNLNDLLVFNRHGISIALVPTASKRSLYLIVLSI